MTIQLSDTVKRLFWGDDINQLRWPEHEKYITQTILDKGDRDDVKWLLQLKSKDELRQSLPSLKLTPRSKTFWTVYLS